MLKQAERNRQKQPHINVALCGKQEGIVDSDDDDDDDENVSELGSEGARSGRSGDSEEAEADSDDDRVERAVRSGGSYPLAHRLMSADEFKLNNQWESMLSHPGETSALLQTHKGVDLDDGFLMMRILKEMADAPRVHVISGRGDNEIWDEIRADKLDPMFKTFRDVFSKQLNQRFHVSTTPKLTSSSASK
uniref:Uncharacterized protein n=1 Tax=Coccolithus braarudii TaxID=221442 RepID=A0A7S0QAH5_9EUKA|mmetsp:Transcript_52650/g.112650  ORF Transcript_52650/g.112650 Transcript_52650/m.112650 type:complete len:191 (+) Transcript_52650:453-1025(+)